MITWSLDWTPEQWASWRRSTHTQGVEFLKEKPEDTTRTAALGWTLEQWDEYRQAVAAGFNGGLLKWLER